MGFCWLDNDDQLGAVISHELGHKISEHSLKTFLQMIDQNELDRITLQDIKSTKENRNERAFKVMKNRIYRKGAEKRKR
jgi:predicted Zn-dependent protease